MQQDKVLKSKLETKSGAEALASALSNSLPENVFRELTEYIKTGDVDSLYKAMQTADFVRHPEYYVSKELNQKQELENPFFW